MTKERAISLLRRYRQRELKQPRHYSAAVWSIYEFGEKSYTRSVVAEMIRRIRDSPDDQNPLLTVHQFIEWIDGIRLNDGNPIKNKFIGNVVWICDNLEQYLWEEEKNV